MDVLNYIYWISFVVGTGYVLFAGVMGMAGGFDTDGGDVGMDAHDIDVDGHDFDVDGHEFELEAHDLDIDADVDAEGIESEHDSHGSLNKDYGENLAHAGGHSPDLANFNPFSLVSISSFLAAFGGGGILAGMNGLGLALSILAALLAGTVMAVLFYLLVGKLLFSMQGTSQARDMDMLGMEAEVITPLSHDKTGEIAYNLRGTRFTSPARLTSEGSVGRNEKVRIRRKKNNTVYVDRPRKLLE